MNENEDQLNIIPVLNYSVTVITFMKRQVIYILFIYYSLLLQWRTESNGNIITT